MRHLEEEKKTPNQQSQIRLVLSFLLSLIVLLCIQASNPALAQRKVKTPEMKAIRVK